MASAERQRRRAAAVERRQLGWMVGHHGVLGKGQQREARAAGDLGGDAWSGAEAAVGLRWRGNSSGRRCCHAAEEVEEEEEGEGVLGTDL
jgi:hypothetical protein